MSKEVIRSNQFAHVKKDWNDEALTLNKEQSQELNALYEGIVDRFKPGKIVVGKIINIDSNGVLVDIGYKSHGLIPFYEFSEHELKKLAVGSEIEVILDELENLEGNLSLSYEKAKALRAWAHITTLFEENKPVEGAVTHKVRGGLSVDIGIPAFLPGSQVDVQRVADFDQYVGQMITAYIIKINQKRGNVIISRRKFLNDQRQESRKKVLEGLKEGSIIQGIVKNITNYGVFIDIGGVDGLLHITDMTWGRINHPSELLKIGDKVAVKVLSFDKDNEKISLGMKQLTDNPWATVGEDIKVGAQVKGRISSITDYGLFVEIQKGVEGLVHISEVSWTDRIHDLHKHFKVSDLIDVLIVSLDKENRRMSLSIKQLQKNPWQAIGEQFKVGQKIKGQISNITDFGIFVQLLPGIDGLVHISDLSWTEHITHPADIYKKGQEVEAIVLSVDEANKRIALGIKQLQQNPWELIEQEYPVGKIIEGEVSKITNFGAFVKLPIGIEGLVHISELSKNNVDNVGDVLKVGQKYQFRVIKVSKEEHKLGLSLKLKDDEETKDKKPAKKETMTMQDKPVRREKRPEQQQQQSATKQKSMLQIELEKHAARRENESNESEE
jgi:small subunit ribosomal protein S1